MEHNLSKILQDAGYDLGETLPKEVEDTLNKIFSNVILETVLAYGSEEQVDSLKEVLDVPEKFYAKLSEVVSSNPDLSARVNRALEANAKSLSQLLLKNVTK